MLPEERLETPPLTGLGSWDPLQESLLRIRKDRIERTPQERGGQAKGGHGTRCLRFRVFKIRLFP